MKIGVSRQLDRGHMIFALVLMAQFQFWDGIMTQVFVNIGLVREANHLMAPLVAGGDFLFLKLLGIAALLCLLWIVHKVLPRIALLTASSLALFYLTVITWNFAVLFSTPF